jgi:hypothetical protein
MEVIGKIILLDQVSYPQVWLLHASSNVLCWLGNQKKTSACSKGIWIK